MGHYQPGAQSGLGPHAASGFTSEELRVRARREAARAGQGPRILVAVPDDERPCGIESAEGTA